MFVVVVKVDMYFVVHIVELLFKFCDIFYCAYEDNENVIYVSFVCDDF